MGVSEFPKSFIRTLGSAYIQMYHHIKPKCSVEGPALRCPNSEGTQRPQARLTRGGQNLGTKRECKCRILKEGKGKGNNTHGDIGNEELEEVKSRLVGVTQQWEMLAHP